jgi:hypothetical protein
MGATEVIGRVIGALAAPFAAMGSLIRGARIFHPDGVLYRAEVRAVAATTLARALEGPALVRLSGAMWRDEPGAERPDILGVAVRLQPGEPTAQDLIFATFRSALTLPLGPFTTDAHDYLGNIYYTALPSLAPELGRVELRLVPEPVPPQEMPGCDRAERLQHAVVAGLAVLWLEVRPLRAGASWRRLAGVELRERLPGGGADLRFNPFLAGLGIQPTGLLQAVRSVVYPASQLGRSLARRARR